MAKVIPCEVYSRVVGYFRPVQNWNNGKRAEYSDRQAFSEEASMKEPVVEERQVVEEQPQAVHEPPTQEQVTVNVNGSTNTSNVSGFKIYTLPGCEKCVEVKSFLTSMNLSGTEVNLRNSEGMDDFKEFYKTYRDRIKRGEDRTALLPIVVLGDGMNNIVGIAQSLEEVKSYL
jgi:glutaredoxin